MLENNYKHALQCFRNFILTFTGYKVIILWQFEEWLMRTNHALKRLHAFSARRIEKAIYMLLVYGKGFLHVFGVWKRFSASFRVWKDFLHAFGVWKRLSTRFRRTVKTFYTLSVYGKDFLHAFSVWKRLSTRFRRTENVFGFSFELLLTFKWFFSINAWIILKKLELTVAKLL